MLADPNLPDELDRFHVSYGCFDGFDQPHASMCTVFCDGVILGDGGIGATVVAVQAAEEYCASLGGTCDSGLTGNGYRVCTPL